MLGVVAVGSLAAEREARACGGGFLPPTETETVTTDHRMILSISDQQTTLYDQIEYHGSPSSFAWVLPIKGTVTVGLSADILFDTLDSLTATQVVEPTPDCPAAPVCGNSGFEAPTAGAAADDAGARGGVTVTAQAQVGPYETVQLHSTDGSALTNWLASNGFSVPSGAAPILAAYVALQFDFLAMKLIPGQGVEAMQPVRVTSTGSSPTMPMRMVSIGTGATTGITLWVVADARWEPQNAPFFTITDSELVWDWTTNSSNYDSLRLSKEAALGGKGWQVESSLELDQASITNQVEQNVEFGGPQLQGGYGTATGDGGLPPAQQDLGALLSGIGGGNNVRITRMRGDISNAALAGSDLTLQTSADQSQMSNLYNPAKQSGEPLCPVYNDSCSVVGSAPLNQMGVSASGGSAAGSGCNAAPAKPGSSAALASLAGLLGFVVVQARRRRRSGR
jgi:uncharacterized protein (TIGR03382 family)